MKDWTARICFEIHADRPCDTQTHTQEHTVDDWPSFPEWRIEKFSGKGNASIDSVSALVRAIEEAMEQYGGLPGPGRLRR